MHRQSCIVIGQTFETPKTYMAQALEIRHILIEFLDMIGWRAAIGSTEFSLYFNFPTLEFPYTLICLAYLRLTIMKINIRITNKVPKPTTMAKLMAFSHFRLIDSANPDRNRHSWTRSGGMLPSAVLYFPFTLISLPLNFPIL